MTNRKPAPGDVEVKRGDKVFFPRDGITKGDLIHFYRAVADPLLSHVRERPLTLQRFPDGIDTEGFYQKQAPDYFPEWMGRTVVELGAGGRQSQVVVATPSELVYLANQGVITFHAWTSRADDLRKPDQMVFDLDPSGGDFAPVRKAARTLRSLLDRVELCSFLMLTGSTGAHVRVPLRRGPGFDEVRDFARSLAEHLSAEFPDALTTEVRKEKRGNRLFLDVARNAYGQTAVTPYSVRPREGAPVAAPLDWTELGKPGLGSTRFTVRSVPRRLGQREDPWKGMQRHARSLSKAREKFLEIRESLNHE
jgi:bifunctional non-homologous end joining protein LigD